MEEQYEVSSKKTSRTEELLKGLNSQLGTLESKLNPILNDSTPKDDTKKVGGYSKINKMIDDLGERLQEIINRIDL